MSDDSNAEYLSENTQGWESLSKLLPKYEMGEQSLGFLAKRHFKSAIDHFEKAIQLNESGWESWWGLGKLDRVNRQLANGFEKLEKAADLDGDALELYLDLANYALELGESVKADQYARVLVEQSPQDPELLSLYAVALVMNKQTKRALGVATNACKFGPNNSRTWEILEFVKRIDKGQEPVPESIRL